MVVLPHINWYEALGTNITGLTPGRTYQIPFYLAPWEVVVPGEAHYLPCREFNVRVAGQDQSYNTPFTGGWSQHIISFTASSMSHVLEIAPMDTRSCVVNFALGVSPLDVIKTAELEGPLPGDSVNFTISIENTGVETLTGVTVESDILERGDGTPLTLTSGPTFVSNSGASAPGTLQPGEVATFEAAYTLTPADTDVGRISNQAIGVGISPTVGRLTAYSRAEVDGDQEPTDVDIPAAPDIRLEKAGQYVDTNASGIPDVGDHIEYVFTLTNTGNVTLDNILVSDDIAVVSGSLPELAAGASDSTAFTASYAITQGDIDEGAVDNSATVRASSPAGVTVEDTAGVTTPLERVYALTLQKSGAYVDTNGNGVADVGDEIHYDFEVTNTGNATLSSITVSDPGALLVQDTITNLGPGLSDSTTVSGIYALTQDDIERGQVDNTAEAVSEPEPGERISSEATSSVPLIRAPSIALTKSGMHQDTNGNGVADVGDSVVYTFTLENTGNVRLSAITVNDPKVSVQGGPLASLDPGQGDTTTFSATYFLTQGDVNAGRVNNTAETFADSVSGQVSDSASAEIILDAAPDALLIKQGTVVDANGNGRADPGETIDYTFRVENTGNVTLTSLSIADPLVAVSGGPLAQLEPGSIDTGTFNATYTILQSDIDAGKVENVATLTAETAAGETIERQSQSDQGVGPTIVTIEHDPDVQLFMTGAFFDTNGNDLSDAGETIRYELSVLNSGNVTLQDLAITSLTVTTPGGSPVTVPVTGTFSGTLLPGDRDDGTFTAEYQLTQDDLDMGFASGSSIVSATAIVSASDDSGMEVSDISDDPNNPAEVDVEGDGEPDDPTIVSLRQGTSLVAAKSGAYHGDGEGFAEAGDEIHYTVEVTNNGNITLAGIAPEDPGPRFNGVAGTGTLSAFTPGAIDLAPGETGTFEAVYQLSGADIRNAQNIVDGIENTAFARGVDPLGRLVVSPEAAALVNLPGILIGKTSAFAEVRRGDRVPYTIKAAALEIGELDPVNVIDFIPIGFSYVQGSATIAGNPVEPSIEGRRIAFEQLTLTEGKSVEIALTLQVSSSVKPGSHENHAWLEDQSGKALTQHAIAVVDVVAEAVFDCGDIIGKVFDDKNRNGYQDAGEGGMPGVRLSSVKGLQIATDVHGRFHVACADLPDRSLGTNYTLKLDPRSLPTGYRITTENPRVVRLTAGKMTQVNFGVSIGRVVRLEVTDAAFEPGEVDLLIDWQDQLRTLVALLEREPSVLRLAYQNGTAGSKNLATRRVRMLKRRIADEWRRAGGRYRLDIETRMLK
ncbi:hypothetical protein [uncultured Nitratireductor sp.]|uniref:DUF7507 domain-containing protein n=1 Tax=uncultured Nitratireductor sp. TaxID=520953 RepID=UPI0025F94F4E|nr:hypothetical protein [uncultured Nitratireductor sp.]